MAKKKTKADGTPKRQRFDRQGERFQVWRNVSASTAANAADLPQAAIPLAALEQIIAEIDRILIDQDAFQASKQMTSQRLRSLLSQGNKLTTVLKVIIRQHYGIGSDKLVEFGIQPLRTRPKITGVEPPVVTSPVAGTPVAIPVIPTLPGSK